MKASRITSGHGGIWLKLAVVLAVLSACLALAWMVVLPLAVARLVRARTGCAIEIQTLYANPFTAHLALHGLVITNPPAFPRREFIVIRDLQVDARLRSLFTRRWEIDRAMLDVAGISIVRDQHGLVNVRLLRSGLAGASPDQPPAEARPAGREFLIRHLEVRLDRLVIADYSKRTPVVREFNLNFRHTYENVTSAKQLAEPLASAFAGLGGAVGEVVPEFGAVLRTAGGTLEETGRKAGEAVKGFFESLEKTFKK